MMVIKGEVGRLNIFAGSILTIFLIFFLYIASLSIMDIKEMITNDTMTVTELISEIIVVTIINLVFLFPILWCLFFFIITREIAIDEDMIIIRIFKPKAISYEQIKRISVEFFIVINNEKKDTISISNISIKPKRRIHPFFINGDHFTDQQRMKIFCLLKQSDKLENAIWKYRYTGHEPNKRGMRIVKHEEVKEYLETLWINNGLRGHY